MDSKRIYCGHCFKYLSRSAFYQHRRLYFDIGGNKWTTVTDAEADTRSGNSKNTSPTASYCHDQLINVVPNNDTSFSTHHQIPDDSNLSYDDDITGANHSLTDDGSNDNEEDEPRDQLENSNPRDHDKGVEIWDDADIMEIESLENGLSDNQDAQDKQATFATISTLFIFCWQKLYNISDNAVNAIFMFLRLFLQMIGYQECQQMPSSLYMARKVLNINRDDFVQYAVCGKCHKTHVFRDCYSEETRRGSVVRVPKKCDYVKFPNHKQRKMRQPCNGDLVKIVQGITGRHFVYPRRVYCYQSIIWSLQRIVSQKNFKTLSNSWRHRDVSDDTLYDIYDGNVWKYFESHNYFDSPYNLSFTLNVDWFQAFDHVTNSTGAIYMSINNLPQSCRIKVENVILVGLLEGPDEPKTDMNSYLQPLVNELQQLWRGILIKDGTSFGNVYRGALMCVSADIPACRKCAGFVGHGAIKGCSKCCKTFSREKFGEPANYSDFGSNYPPRTDDGHITFAKLTLDAKTGEELKALERQYGARWSALYDLEYYKPVTFHSIDTMHNLLMGSAKRVTQLLISNDTLSEEKLRIIQERVDKVKLPSNCGSVPSKIKTGFSGLTADQWKTWVVVHSVYALEGMLPNSTLQMWKEFVQAVDILTAKSIKVANVPKAHNHLVSFCNMFEKEFGAEACTMNMHLHMHLAECIYNFGPSHAVWCFPFERYNGILGKYSTNNHAITVQIMRKFITGQQVSSIQWSEGYEPFASILDCKSENRGSLRTHIDSHSAKILRESRDVFNMCDFSQTSEIICHPPRKLQMLENDDFDDLYNMYTNLYPEANIINVYRCVEEVERVTYNGNEYCKLSTRYKRSACIQAKWLGQGPNGSCCIDSATNTQRAGFIVGIMKSKIVLKDDRGNVLEKCLILLELDWFQMHEYHDFYGVSCKVHSPQPEYTANHARYMPVQRVSNKCAVVKDKVKLPSGEESVHIIVPL